LYDYAAHDDYSEASTWTAGARQRAHQMTNWLVTTQLKSGAFPSGVDPHSGSNPSVFNTGQVLLGLVRAFRETGDEEFLDAIKQASTWLVDVQNEAGYWDQFDYRNEIHSYCSRVAWALLGAYDVTGDSTFSESAITHLEWVTSIQTDANWFEFAAFSPDEVPYLHTIAYTVRGLLEGGLWLDDDVFVSAAKATADRLITCRQQEGALYGAYDRLWNPLDFYCLTGNAQMVLIWLRLYERFGDKQYLDIATSELEFLKAHHLTDGPLDLKGGLKGSYPVWGPYLRLRYPNWATKFFCDAIMVKTQVV
jgi:rhamnogalacturonyl hydrolase YesR